MKKLTIVLTVLSLAIIGSPALAKKKERKTKQQRVEMKTWRKRKAAMHPLQLKALIEENHKLKKRVEEMQMVTETLEGIIEFKTQLLAQKEAQQRQDDRSKEAHKDMEQSLIVPEWVSKYEWAMDEEGRFYIKGVVFKVQIGAYKQRDLHLMLEEADRQEAFTQESSGGLNKYTLMYFRDYWQANQFKKELRAMGVKDAFIVAFQDGKRVPLKAVLPTVIQQKK